MSAQPRNVNLDILLKARRTSRIEFWRDNGNGTCTRMADGLTLSYTDYNMLPSRHEFVDLQRDPLRGGIN